MTPYFQSCATEDAFPIAGIIPCRLIRFACSDRAGTGAVLSGWPRGIELKEALSAKCMLRRP